MKIKKSLHGSLAASKLTASLLPAFALLVLTMASGHAQSGTWTLNGTGLWSGSANWQGGTIADGPGNTATFIGGGATIHLDSSRTMGNLASGAAGSYVIDNNSVAGNVLTLDGGVPTITTVSSSTLTVSAIISGTLGLTKANLGGSSGVLVLTGANTYSGTTNISGGNSGFIQINSNAALGASSVLISSQNGGLRYGAAFNDLRDITFGSGGGRLDTNGFDVTISSALSGSIAPGSTLTKQGAGTLTLAGNNSIIGGGGVAVTQGALKIDSDARLGSGTGGLTLNGGTLIYGAAFNNLRSITLGNSDGTLDTNGFNVTYSSSLTGGVGQNLTKAGSGTLTLQGTQTYSGTTIVSAGTLLVDGSHTSTALAVNANATLGGNGTIGGATTINNNGTLAPGDLVGTLTINNSLTLNNGATYIFQGGDLVDVNGVLTLNNNWTLSLGSGLADGGSITLFTFDSLAAGWDDTPTFNLTNLGFTPTGPLSLTTVGNSIVLNGVQLVPEPSAAVLLAAAGMLGLARRRRVS